MVAYLVVDIVDESSSPDRVEMGDCARVSSEPSGEAGAGDTGAWR